MAKKYSLYSPTAYLRRSVYRRSRENRGWLSMAAALWLLRTARRVMSSQPETAAVERLKPGQSMTITAIAPPTRQERRAAKQSRRRR